MGCQYSEIFKYELIKLENNFYKLIVSRYEKPNCPVTANFFWCDGWTLNLIVSNIPKLEKFNNRNPKSQYFIKNYLPKDYGEVFTDIPDNFKLKIGITIPFFGRYKYVKNFLIHYHYLTWIIVF